jgi:rhodanese-related sulfurtransferase
VKRIALMLIVALTLVVTACGGGTEATSTPPGPTVSTSLPGSSVAVDGGGTYWAITPTQLAGFKTKDFFLADTDASYIGEIQGTDLFINPADINANLNKFPADKSTKIVLYCTMGIQSQGAAITLVKAGYTRVMELQGGITAWKNQGYQILFMTRTMI